MPDQPRSGRDWISDLARRLGTEPPSDEELDQLLDLAGVAAHASERIAAPIACWMVGRAGVDPASALALARRV